MHRPSLLTPWCRHRSIFARKMKNEKLTLSSTRVCNKRKIRCSASYSHRIFNYVSTFLTNQCVFASILYPCTAGIVVVTGCIYAYGCWWPLHYYNTCQYYFVKPLSFDHLYFYTVDDQNTVFTRTCLIFHENLIRAENDIYKSLLLSAQDTAGNALHGLYVLIIIGVRYIMHRVLQSERHEVMPTKTNLCSVLFRRTVQSCRTRHVIYSRT